MAAVEEICCHPRGSAERIAILKTVAARDGIPERTLYDLCRRYDEHGRGAFIHGSTGKRTGQRIAVSRKFDAAFAAAFLKAGGSQEALAEALDELRDYINLRAKAEWASEPGRAGAVNVAREVSTSLKRTYYHKPVAGILAALPVHLFEVTRDRVDKPTFRNFRIVDEKRHDRKKYQDNAPHITRDWTGFAPMECVIADVKPLDVKVERPDGTTAYPRLLAFLDAGTQRMFYRVLHHPKNHQTAQEHIIDAFMAMVEDPEWGVPRVLYMDNGSEFKALHKIAHYLKQIAPKGRGPIVKARPYAAASKPIEGTFGSRLDRYVISQMKGWTGGDRMKSKVSNVGKKPDAYPGMFDVFCKELAERIEDMMLRPIHGERNRWEGRSAREIFEVKRQDGWFPIVPTNPFALEMALWDRAEKTINRGVIRHDGRKFHHPDLPPSGKFEVLVSYKKEEAPILILADGTSIQLQEDYPFAGLDQAGAKEAGRRKTRHARNVRKMAKEVPPSDADANRRYRIEKANALFPPREPVPLLPAIDTGGENDRAARTVATAKKSPPKLSADEVQKSHELPHGLEPTWIARFLFNSMQRIHDRRGIAIFSGPPGIGKTTAIEAFARSTHCVLHITVSPRTRATALIQHIKEALRPHINMPSGSSWNGTYSLQQNLARDMRQFARSHGASTDLGWVEDGTDWVNVEEENKSAYPRLTAVIDEAQHLQREAIEHLRYLNDAKGFPFPVGLVIIGNNELSLKADMDGTSQISAAVADRADVMHELSYQYIEDGDVLLLLEKNGIACKDARNRLLAKLRAARGVFSFRIVERAAEQALALAGGQPVTVDTIEKLHV